MKFGEKHADPIDPDIIRDYIASAIVASKEQDFSLMVNVRVPTNETGLFYKISRLFYNALVIDDLSDIEHTASIPHFIEIVKHTNPFGFEEWYCMGSEKLNKVMQSYNKDSQQN